MTTNTNAPFGYNEDGSLKASFGLKADGIPRKSLGGRPPVTNKTVKAKVEPQPVSQLVLGRKGVLWIAQYSVYKGEGTEVAEAMNNLKENVKVAFVQIQSVADFLGVSTALTELKEKIKAKNKPKAKAKRKAYLMTPEDKARRAAQPFKTSRMIEQRTLESELVATFESVRETARAIKCSPQQIRFKAEDGKPYKGFLFNYAPVPAQPTEPQENLNGSN